MKKYGVIFCVVIVSVTVMLFLGTSAVGDDFNGTEVALSHMTSSVSRSTLGIAAANFESAAENDENTPVYFFIEDEDTVITVLKLLNTNDSIVRISGTAYFWDGTVNSSFTLDMNPNQLVTIGTDPMYAYNGELWPVPNASYARFMLPPGVIIDGWIAQWEDPEPYDSRIPGSTRPLNFIYTPTP